MAIYIFLNGSVNKDNVFMDDNVEEVIAVDGGFNNIPQVLKGCNLRIIGDLDSIDDHNDYQHYPIMQYPKEKDFSDFELALKYVSDTYKDKIVRIYGLLGGRIDHQLFNIFVLFNHIQHNDFIAYGEKEVIYFPRGNISIKNLKGSTFSIFPFEKLEGLTVKGAKYELVNKELETYNALTLSNEITSVLNVTVKKGFYALIINI